MFDHLGVVIRDLRIVGAFHRTVLAPLGTPARAAVDAFHEACLAAGAGNNDDPGMRRDATTAPS
jgi:hypothetical protein